MAQKPDGKPAKSVAVTFTRPAAERIANVVRTVERSGRDTKGPVWNPRMGGGGGTPTTANTEDFSFRFCSFSGQWQINTKNLVTFATYTPATALAINKLFTVGDACQAQNAYVGLARDEPSTALIYHLVNVQHWEEEMVTHISLGTAALEFTKKLVWLPYPGVTAAQFINISTATSC